MDLSTEITNTSLNIISNEPNNLDQDKNQPDKNQPDFQLDVDFEISKCIYIHRVNGTCWIRRNKQWVCAVCKDELLLCRGCGGMYNDCFGSCGYPSLLCPNCVCLQGPMSTPRFYIQGLRFIRFNTSKNTKFKENRIFQGDMQVENLDEDENEIKDKNTYDINFVTFVPDQIVDLEFDVD